MLMTRLCVGRKGHLRRHHRGELVASADLELVCSVCLVFSLSVLYILQTLKVCASLLRIQIVRRPYF